MRGMWKAVAPLAALSLSLAACAGDDGDDAVATLGGDTGSTGASASPSVDPEDALAEFAECMRENGIEDFPDPQIDEDGGITIGIGDGEAPTEEDREQIDAAMEACQDLLPQGEGPGQISEEDQAAFRDAMLEYAQCMRENGIEDFPDPEFSGDGGVMQEIGEGIDPNSDEFREADEACRPALEQALPDLGDGGEVTTNEQE